MTTLSKPAGQGMLPNTASVSSLLRALLGKPVVVRPGPPFALDARRPAAVAVYGYDDGSPAAACVCDLEFACNSGAALSLIPAEVAVESIRRGEMPDAIWDNLNEVLNVCARLFSTADDRHLALRATYGNWHSVPGLVMTFLNHPAARLDLELTIQGYGSGKLSLLAG